MCVSVCGCADVGGVCPSSSLSPSFLHDRSSAAGQLFVQVLEELQVQDKVRSVSSGIDDTPPPPAPPSAMAAFQLQGMQAAAAAGFSMSLPPLPPQPAPPSSTSSRFGPPAPSAPTTGEQDSRRPGKRNRWGPSPGSPAREGRSPTTAVSERSGLGSRSRSEEGGSQLPDGVMTQYLPKETTPEVEKQLKEQKKLQMLEQRIRDAAKAQLKGA